MTGANKRMKAPKLVLLLELSIRRRPRWAGLVTRVLVGLGLLALVAIGPHGWRARASTDRFVSPSGDDMAGANDCSSSNKPCKTIQNAVNQSMTGDLIELAPGTYFENVMVSQNVTIQGDAFNGSTVNGNNSGSVFTIKIGITATLDMLTITNGNSGDPFNIGGGILNFGLLTVTGCTINGNQASGSASTPTRGGGICNNLGFVTVINSTISGNSAKQGGGISNDEGSLTVVNSTISGNTATSGGGIHNAGGMHLTNTIIAGSLSGGDCVNSLNILTNDRNLIQDGSCSPAISGNPKLGPLQNNGGPTFTQALLAGSPAVDAGDDSVLGGLFSLTTDQRGSGFTRKACAHVDIGAYEFDAGNPPAVTCPANISVFSDPGKTTANVSFTVTATDVCDGALTPVCKVGGSPITSGFSFPTGVTTVVCSATNSQGLTGNCSFTVTVTQLNICIQDNITGDTLRLSSQTGQYVYTRCRDKFTLTGTGMVRTVAGIVTLTDSRPDRKINASFNLGQLTGKAYITLIPAPGVSQTITLFDTNPRATCQCP
jgi:hypothetical protein